MITKARILPIQHEIPSDLGIKQENIKWRKEQTGKIVEVLEQCFPKNKAKLLCEGKFYSVNIDNDFKLLNVFCEHELAMD